MSLVAKARELAWRVDLGSLKLISLLPRTVAFWPLMSTGQTTTLGRLLEARNHFFSQNYLELQMQSEGFKKDIMFSRELGVMHS